MARTKKVKSVFVNEKEWTVESIRELIKSSDAAAIRAMVRINEYQTAYEKEAATTVDRNYVGFAGCHAFLSKFVESYQKFGKLSEKQMVWVRKAMPKYAGQIFRIMVEEAKARQAAAEFEEAEPMPGLYVPTQAENDAAYYAAQKDRLK